MKSVSYFRFSTYQHIAIESMCWQVFCVKIRAGVLVVDDLNNPPPKKKYTTNNRVNNLMREIAHAQKRNPSSDVVESLQNGRHLRHNQVGKFWWRSVKGFSGGGGQILAFPIDFDRRPYNTLALPCECVIVWHIKFTRVYSNFPLVGIKIMTT